MLVWGQIIKDLDEIKVNARKSEYEKITEPLNRRIVELEVKLEEREKKLQALYITCKDFIENNIKGNEICLLADKPHLRWYDSDKVDEEIEELKFVRIRITDEDILKEFYERLAEVHKDIYKYRIEV